MTGITLKCGGSSIVLDPSGVTLKGAMVTVDGAMVKIASGPGSPPKAGQAGSAVAPAAPEGALEADTADPGKVSEAKAKTVQRQQAERPFRPVVGAAAASGAAAGAASNQAAEEEEKTWIEIELLDEDDQPVAGEKYKVTLPDGSVKTGTLDENGFARVDGVDPGTCKVTFPNLDRDAWDKA
jgi:type VI secretion system secreted protein VgrG